MKLGKLIYLIAFWKMFDNVVMAQETKVRTRMMLFANKDYLNADSLIQNFNFYFSDLKTVAGMVDVPPPVKAEVWKDFYKDENGEKMYHTHIICLAQPINSLALSNLIVEEKITKRAVYIFDLHDSTVNEWTVLRIPFKLGGFSVQDISKFNLLDDPSYLLHQGMIHKRATKFSELSKQAFQKIIENKQLNLDTLCNNQAYPAYKASVFLVKNSMIVNDSLSFVIKLKMPKKYQHLNIHHVLRYVQPEELDTEPKIEIRLLFSGNISKEEEEKTLLIRIPSIQKPGQYWLSFAKVLNRNTVEIIANHSNVGCPMIVNIE